MPLPTRPIPHLEAGIRQAQLLGNQYIAGKPNKKNGDANARLFSRPEPQKTKKAQEPKEGRVFGRENEERQKTEKRQVSKFRSIHGTPHFSILHWMRVKINRPLRRPFSSQTSTTFLFLQTRNRRTYGRQCRAPVCPSSARLREWPRSEHPAAIPCNQCPPT